MVVNLESPADNETEVALPPGMFAHLQDTTKGGIRTYVGPTLITTSNQEQPVLYNHSAREFRQCKLREAIRKMPVAAEGDYVVLVNPAEEDKHPRVGEAKQDTPELKMGSKINKPGPCQIALWPGQHAEVIPGHNLKSNEYVECRVYNKDQAQTNWTDATIQRAEKADAETPEDDADADAAATPETTADADAKEEITKKTFKAGERLIIRGDQISFFIPPTGIEAVADEEQKFVRPAVTLERLEYCILIDEGGDKRIERGAKVVFPKPTEVFHVDGGRRKFRATELNPIQGIHIKVIAPYTENNQTIPEGELFLTGENTPLYFPRQEHVLVRYGTHSKHYATAIPPGEGRYLMDRLEGKVETEKGPQMLLPNPINQVIVKRVLSRRQCRLWYPGNTEAEEYNRSLELSNKEAGQDYVETRSLVGAQLESISDYSGHTMAMEEFSRGTTHTKPRTITLDTKYEGVPQICPWTGYAVKVVDKSGNRRVEVGPTTILLNFDETLEVLTLSTGKPKTTDNLLDTVYLKVKNNKVSDIVKNVLTSDHVPLDIKLSFTVDFEDEYEDSWFDIDNYVKYLCDHVRSVLKGRIRKISIRDFWSKGADIIRDFVLGEKPVKEDGTEGDRVGMLFRQNGMHITDVEVLDITIQNTHIQQMLASAEEDAVADHIKLEQATRELENLRQTEEIDRNKLKAHHETALIREELEQAKIEAVLKTKLENQRAEEETAKATQVSTIEKEKITMIISDAKLEREAKATKAELEEAKADQERRVVWLQEETAAAEKRFAAMQAGFSEAALTLSNQDTLTKIVQAGSMQRMLGGDNLVDLMLKIVGDKGLADKVKTIAERAGVGALVEE